MTTRSSSLLFLLAILAVPTGAGPVRPIEVDHLTTAADLIVVARVISVVQEGSTNVEYWGGSTSASQFRAWTAIDKVLKGTPLPGLLPVRFLVPTVALGYQELAPNEYGVFFLKRQRDSYDCADPRYCSLPSVQGQESTSGPPLDQVTTVLGQALGSNNLSDSDRIRVLDALRRLHTQLAGDFLRQALGNASGEFRLEVARSLVARDDFSGFKVVEEALSNSSHLSEETILNLAGSLAGLKDPRAIPGLATLSEASNPTIRRYAARALRQTNSWAAAAPLSKLLNDGDITIRYDAVVGLGEITHQDEWAPALEEFRQHETRYLTHWREWVESNSN
jgi:hypothetical protein